MLIINADAEYGEGRNQNFLRPEDIEKICYVFDNFLKVPGYSDVVSIADIVDENGNDSNLNIRRYVDNTPPAEPHDVKAHLFGGIPQAEITALNGLLTKYGIAETDLFKSCQPGSGRGNAYADFIPADKVAIKTAIQSHNGVATANEKIRATAEIWWAKAMKVIRKVGKSVQVFDFKRDFTEKLRSALEPLGVLDRFQCIGVFANWWEHSYTIREYIEFKTSDDGKNKKVQETISVKNVFKTINAEGFVAALVSDDKIAERHFAAELDTLRSLEQDAENAASELQNYAASIDSGGDDNDNEENIDEVKEVKVSEVEKYLKAQTTKKAKKQYEKIKQLKSDKGTADKAVKKAESELQAKIDAIRDRLSPAQFEELVVELLRESFFAELEKYLTAELDKTVRAVAHLWDKYAVSAETLADTRAAAEKALDDYLRGLGYYG